ncbi:CorA-like Mg2+ transporter protein [Rhizoctonia solani AG-3 Rhs1AP]|uniref:CorA-like Mg2+ transporter protein n=1 Tax=Rhizoctonia solani AG-3 Rhs1AP TaxID=1086054 RepID=X8JWM0_9AGAM|nr:CorA-like Mg2+ transporter protein [Rhizoctonia solani AG-3 Rhs1AP]
MALTLSPIQAPLSLELQPLSPISESLSANMSQLLSVPPTQAPSARDKFRSLVNKVINRRRACVAIQEVVAQNHSLDQGADPRNKRTDLRFGSRITKCTIEVTHYSEAGCRTTPYNNAGLIELLKSDDLAGLQKGEVRWINVAGISWDVVKALAIRFNLHPLSVEDVMTDTHDKSFKIDYYQQHLFTQLTSFKIPEKGTRDARAAVKKLRENSTGHYYITGRAKEHHSQRRQPPRSNTVVPTIQTSDTDAVLRTPIEPPRSLKSRSSTLSELGKSTLSVVQPTLTAGAKLSMVEDAVQTLKLQSGTLDVDTTRLFVFLLKDGNFITIHQSDALYGSELTERLNNPSLSLMRMLPDASMLFHGHLDLIGDNLLTIVDEYQQMILELERGILLKPTLLAVQSLHLISGDIRLLNMAIKPLQRIIYRLRRYDRDRYKAVAPPGENTTTGFMGEESLVYLSDILDHVRFIMLSLDAQNSTTKELINYTFNMTSYDSRDVMKVLLIATVIFLPMMFIAQYFGMNFEPMPSVNNYSDALYWKVAGPVLFVLLLGALRHRIWEFFFGDD